MNDGPIELGVAIVNYNVRDLLRGCLCSLRQAQDVAGLSVCVVDAGSHDGSAEMVAVDFPEVRLIVPGANKGYAWANNLALRALLDGSDRPRYLLLLNPDTVVPPRALREMLDFIREFPAVGATGPRLVMGTGEIDWACRRGFPTPLTSLYHMVGLSQLFPRSRRFGRYRLTFLDERAVAEVDSLVGAFMLVRTEVVEQVGLLDEAFFMYGEDIDWSYRIKRAGWSVVYNGRVDVLHYKRQSSRQSPRASIEFYRSMLIFFRKHYASATPLPVRVAVEAAISTLLAGMRFRSWLSRPAIVHP